MIGHYINSVRERHALVIRYILLMFVFLSALSAAGNLATANEPPAASMKVGDKKLILNGYGIRERWWVDIYLGALYLPKRSRDVNFVLAASTAKAITVRVLYGEIPDKMPATWRASFEEELQHELLGKLKRRFKKLKAGDLLKFTYFPGSGSEVWVNSDKLFADPGHGLISALVDQWMGPQPVSKNLKRLFLNSVN